MNGFWSMVICDLLGDCVVVPIVEYGDFDIIGLCVGMVNGFSCVGVCFDGYILSIMMIICNLGVWFEFYCEESGGGGGLICIFVLVIFNSFDLSSCVNMVSGGICVLVCVDGYVLLVFKLFCNSGMWLNGKCDSIGGGGGGSDFDGDGIDD